MTPNQPLGSYLPHQRLVAYRVAVELLVALRQARLHDARLREQAMRAAQSACLNIGEAAGRKGRADRARVFAIARGEVSEVAVAVEIAAVCGGVDPVQVAPIIGLCARLYALLSGLCRT